MLSLGAAWKQKNGHFCMEALGQGTSGSIPEEKMLELTLETISMGKREGGLPGGRSTRVNIHSGLPEITLASLTKMTVARPLFLFWDQNCI